MGKALQLPRVQANIEDTSTWAKYTKQLCRHCAGSCCSLPVEVKTKDLVRLGLMDEFELDENPKMIARRLKKMRLIEHFHAKSETFTLSRMANGDCLFLDRKLRNCTLYDKRPDTCRNHPRVGPRSGFCAFVLKS